MSAIPEHIAFRIKALESEIRKLRREYGETAPRLVVEHLKVDSLTCLYHCPSDSCKGVATVPHKHCTNPNLEVECDSCGAQWRPHDS